MELPNPGDESSSSWTYNNQKPRRNQTLHDLQTTPSSGYKNKHKLAQNSRGRRQTQSFKQTMATPPSDRIFNHIDEEELTYSSLPPEPPVRKNKKYNKSGVMTKSEIINTYCNLDVLNLP